MWRVHPPPHRHQCLDDGQQIVPSNNKVIRITISSKRHNNRIDELEEVLYHRLIPQICNERINASVIFLSVFARRLWEYTWITGHHPDFVQSPQLQIFPQQGRNKKKKKWKQIVLQFEKNYCYYYMYSLSFPVWKMACTHILFDLLSGRRFDASTISAIYKFCTTIQSRLSAWHPAFFFSFSVSYIHRTIIMSQTKKNKRKTQSVN